MAVGTLKIEAEESVGGVNFVNNATDLVTGLDEGVTLITYTPKPGITRARFKVTEEGAGGVTFSMIAGIK